MRPKLRTMTWAGVVALGGLWGAGADVAKAQLFVNTPAFSLGVGAPAVGFYPAPVVYPSYGVAPIYPVRPYPFIYGRPWYYGRGYYARPFAPFYGYRRYRYW
jgi:hypothetical protein